MPLSDEDITALVAKWRECQKTGTPMRSKDVVQTTKVPHEHGKTCSCCDKPITKYCKTGVCLKCQGMRNRKCKRPDKDTLLQELFSSNFLAVGRKYGVSDNAVRKWCKYYILPVSARDIKRLRVHQESLESEHIRVEEGSN